MASSAPASARWSAISAARGSRVRAPALAPTRGPRTRPAGPRARGVVRPAPARRRVASPRAGTHFQAQAEPELPLGTQIENALLGAFPPGTVSRVRDSLRFTLEDGVHEVHHPGLGQQIATSYVAGLTAKPYWDPHGGAFPWMPKLEAEYESIRDELRAALRDPTLERKGNAVWVAAARDDAEGYGPDWRTLVLQDRCEWEPTNVTLFPETVAAVRKAGAPSVEVFFAKQAPRTGIKPHTDFTNFIMTSHLGLDVPDPPLSWMKVGEETKCWENGVGLTADTSFVHSTSNDSDDADRYVLIVRHWHPELTAMERLGVRFLFDAFEDLSPAGLESAANKAKARVKNLLAEEEEGEEASSPAAAAGEGGEESKRATTATTPGGGRKKIKRNKRKNKAGGEGLGLLAKGMK